MKRNKAFTIFVTRPGCLRVRLKGEIMAPNEDEALNRFYRSGRYDHDAVYEAVAKLVPVRSARVVITEAMEREAAAFARRFGPPEEVDFGG